MTTQDMPRPLSSLGPDSIPNAIPEVIGLARLARLSFDGADLAPLWETLTGTLSDAGAGLPRKYAALMDMALVDQMRSAAARGLGFQAQALAAQRVYGLPAVVTPPRLTLLGFMAGGRINANTPIEFLIEGTDVSLILMYVVPGLPLPPVPAHDAAFVLVSEGEEARPVLRELERLLADWPRPVLNRPERIARTGRECLHTLLAPTHGVSMPATVRVGRGELERVARGELNVVALLPDGGFPVIVRPLDSHAGDGLGKIACAAEMMAYLEHRPEAEFHVSRFVDYRSPDGLYRKDRVVVIDGVAFPVHRAVSEHWMIHYLNAGMLESAAKRAEEARFLDGFATDFGLRHGPAFAAITDALGLDYFGLDCAETPTGDLLVFEAGTALVVHDMDSPEMFPYKRRHMKTIFAAFRALLSRSQGRFAPAERVDLGFVSGP